MRKDKRLRQLASTRKQLLKQNKRLSNTCLEQINLDAAGIDIGSRSHYVAVPTDCDKEPVREFLSFTEDLIKLCRWLKKCKVKTVAMESTGVYWIPLYEMLCEKGFEVKLVDARHVKNVCGRKTDVLDCQWIQQLHTYGLLQGAFIPDLSICALRSYVKQRDMLIAKAASHVQHMQKALVQMNLQLHNVVNDITGITGMKIIRAIVSGERSAKRLSKYRDGRCKRSQDDIRKSLVGNYREEHVFSLKQALELYDYYHEKIAACDVEIEKKLRELSTTTSVESNEPEHIEHKLKKRRKNDHHFDLGKALEAMLGIRMTAIPGVDASTVLHVISVIGTDMRHWKNEKCFVSWLGVCPGTKVSGGKRLSGKSKRTANKAALALRLAAQTLYRSQTALGAYYRRMRARIGAPKAITATARKLAAIFYRMLKYKSEFIDMGQDYYEKQYRNRIMNNLRKKAAQLDMQLVPLHQTMNTRI